MLNLLILNGGVVVRGYVSPVGIRDDFVEPIIQTSGTLVGINANAAESNFMRTVNSENTAHIGVPISAREVPITENLPQKKSEFLVKRKNTSVCFVGKSKFYVKQNTANGVEVISQNKSGNAEFVANNFGRGTSGPTYFAQESATAKHGSEAEIRIILMAGILKTYEFAGARLISYGDYQFLNAINSLAYGAGNAEESSTQIILNRFPSTQNCV
jgi:hypothetical protein